LTAATPPGIEISPDRLTSIGELPIRRALPRVGQRTIGAWCFIDHMGPFTVSDTASVDIGPHPHIGLQTVTWLLAGELVHTDSLGSEVTIRPGQLNLMTAGAGVVHAEEARGYHGPVHGAQLWVALPEDTRHGPAAFEQQRHLPEVELGAAVATVLTGHYAGATAATRADTPLVGVDLSLRTDGGGTGKADLPLDPSFEHAVVVLDGALALRSRSTGSSDGQELQVVEPGSLAYLPAGLDVLGVESRQPTRALLLGGQPFGERVSMWWNFVARTHDEIDEAARAWSEGRDRFGPVASPLARIPAPPRPWGVGR
jgi:redox-sensitive bicupin YhaK (pirin superfamily)